MPPELMPQMPRPAASSRSLYCLADLGQDLLLQEARRTGRDSVSYSKLRLLTRLLPFAVALPGTTPGLMKMPIVTGISFLWMRLSKTMGTRVRPVRQRIVAAVLEDHDAGRRLPSYCAGT